MRGKIQPRSFDSALTAATPITHALVAVIGLLHMCDTATYAFLFHFPEHNMKPTRANHTFTDLLQKRLNLAASNQKPLIYFCLHASPNTFLPDKKKKQRVIENLDNLIP